MAVPRCPYVQLFITACDGIHAGIMRNASTLDTETPRQKESEFKASLGLHGNSLSQKKKS